MNESAILTALAKESPVTIHEISRRTGLDPKTVKLTIQWLVGIGVPINTSAAGKLSVDRRIIPIDANKICQAVGQFSETMAGRIDYFHQVDSTNEHLLSLAASSDIHKRVCIAEYMTAGRGRRKRKWLGSAYEDIFMSLAWNVQGDLTKLSGLSLAVAVLVIEALKLFTPEEIQVKWPNDLLWNKRKLGGILIESQGSTAVIGIGINCRMSTELKNEVRQPATSLADMPNMSVDRNELICALLLELNHGLRQFFAEGLVPFADAWERAHAYSGQWLSVDSNASDQGRAIGIDSGGALLLQRVDGTIASIRSGEVSVRPEAKYAKPVRE